MNTDEDKKKKNKDQKKEEKKEDDPNAKEITKPVDEADIDLLKRYGKGPYSEKIKAIEEEVKTFTKDINKLCGIRESDTGLALPSNWVIEVNKKLYNLIRKIFFILF